MKVVPLPEGDVLVCLHSSDSLVGVARLAQAVARRLRESFPTTDVIVGGTSVLVVGGGYLPLAEALRAPLSEGASEPQKPCEIPVVYDGPDLERVAELTGLSTSAVVGLHSSGVYECMLNGFLPGFSYLGVLPGRLVVPRRTSPRARVPAGSVAIAGAMTAVYPSASAGGWHLLGRTDPQLVLGESAEVAIQPGTHVRFLPVARLAASSSADHAVRTLRPTRSGRDLEVARVGVCTVQDLGRHGSRGLGFPGGGAWDPRLLACANESVGNDPAAAGLELLAGGLELVALSDLQISLDGGPARALRPGERFAVASRSACSYLAIWGGLDVPLLAKSRSTLLTAGLGGLGGRPLRRGDRLSLLPGSDRSSTAAAATPPTSPTRGHQLQVNPWAPDARLGEQAFAALLVQPYEITVRSRLGVRLQGTPLPLAGAPAVQLPEPCLDGCIQVPPDGQPILLGPEAAVTGGYPVVGRLTSEARAQLAHLAVGAKAWLISEKS